MILIFKVENVLVKDFNKEESLKRAISMESNRLKSSVGLDILEKKLKKTRKVDESILNAIVAKRKEIENRMKKIEEEKQVWVERREREFYDNQFERSKFKRGVGDVMNILKVMKDRNILDVVFVSDYKKSKVERILWSNGLRGYIIENCHGNWLDKILKDSGKQKDDIVYFSNNSDDMERGVEWGITIERLDLDSEGISGFMSKIGVKTKNNGE